YILALMGIRGVLAALGLVFGLAGIASAQEPAAVVTELKRGGPTGVIEVRRAAESTWTPAYPLLSLFTGDNVRVRGEGRAVVLLVGGGGARVITAGTSPFAVPAPRLVQSQDTMRGVLGS